MWVGVVWITEPASSPWVRRTYHIDVDTNRVLVWDCTQGEECRVAETIFVPFKE